MVKKFKNRYGDKITFSKSGDVITMVGGDYYRYLSHTDNSDGYYAVDPSGGPFISVGMDMGCIHNDFKGLTVSEITLGKDIILKIK